MNILPSLFIALNLTVCSTITSAQTTTPNTTLTPYEVVQIVIDALRTNDTDANDNGIATVYAFASPMNKRVTGPLPRFKKMLKGAFSDMLNHSESDFGEIDIKDNIALQAVWLTSSTGEETGYVFQIGKQSDGEFKDMWMTESVWPIGKRDDKGQSI